MKAEAIKCKHCHSDLISLGSNTSIIDNSKKEGSMLSAGWIIGALLIPIVGVIGGVWGLTKGRDGAGVLLGIGIVI